MSVRRLMYVYDSLADRLHIGWEGSFDVRPLRAIGTSMWAGTDDRGLIEELVIDLTDGVWPPGSLDLLDRAFGPETTRWIDAIGRTRDTDGSRQVPVRPGMHITAVNPPLPGEPGIPTDSLGSDVTVQLSDGKTIAVTRTGDTLSARIDADAARHGGWLVVSDRASGELLGMSEITHDGSYRFTAAMSFAAQIPTSSLHFQLTNEPLSPTPASADRRKDWLAELLAAAKRDQWKHPATASHHATAAIAVASHLDDARSRAVAESIRRTARLWRMLRWIAPVLMVGAAVGTWSSLNGNDQTPSPIEGVYFENCDAARAAGPTPLRPGDAGYRVGLDRDRDGLACE